MRARTDPCVFAKVVLALVTTDVLGDEPGIAGVTPPELEVVRALPAGEAITVVRDGRRMTTLRRDRPASPRRHAAGTGGGSLTNADFSVGVSGWTWSVSPGGTTGSVARGEGVGRLSQSISKPISLSVRAG